MSAPCGHGRPNQSRCEEVVIVRATAVKESQRFRAVIVGRRRPKLWTKDATENFEQTIDGRDD
jgi:hypothetical protein